MNEKIISELQISERKQVRYLWIFRICYHCRKNFFHLFLDSPSEENEQIKERHLLLRTVHELRTATLNHFEGEIRLIDEMTAERVGRRQDDFAV